MSNIENKNKEDLVLPSIRRHIGKGCLNLTSGLPEHNPKPSSARGKRRHEKRAEGERKKAENAWESPRSNKPSKYQKKLNGN